MLTKLKKHFSSVRHAKPPASRKDSKEMYIIATGFRHGPKAASSQS
jgi:23S rRNA (uridine2552-2'-O)-methyltransferase